MLKSTFQIRILYNDKTKHASDRILYDDDLFGSGEDKPTSDFADVNL